MTDGHDRDNKNRAVLPLVQTVFLSRDAMGVKQIESFSARIFLDDIIGHSGSVWLNGKYEINLEYHGIEGRKLYKNRVSLPLKLEMPSHWQETAKDKINLWVDCHGLEVLSPYVLEFSGDVVAETIVGELRNKAVSNVAVAEAVENIVDENIANDKVEADNKFEKTAKYEPVPLVKEVLAEYEVEMTKDNGIDKGKGQVEENPTAFKSIRTVADLVTAEKDVAEKQDQMQQTKSVDNGVKQEQPVQHRLVEQKNEGKKAISAESRFLNETLKNATSNAEDSGFNKETQHKKGESQRKNIKFFPKKVSAEMEKTTTLAESEDADLDSLKARTLLKLKKRNGQKQEMTAESKTEKAVAENKISGKIENQTAEKANIPVVKELEIKESKKADSKELPKAAKELPEIEEKNKTIAAAANNDSNLAEEKETFPVALEANAEQGSEAEQKTEVLPTVSEGASMADVAPDSDLGKMDLTLGLVKPKEKTDQTVETAVVDAEQRINEADNDENPVDEIVENKIVATSGLIANLQMNNDRSSGFMENLRQDDNRYFYLSYDRIQAGEDEIWQKTGQ